MSTPSDYGALLAENAQLRKNQRPSTAKMLTIGGLLVSLAGTPMAVELAKPDPPPPATKHDIESLRREVAALREYLQDKHGADEKRWRVVTSALDRSGFRVRGMSGGGVQWRSKNARSEEYEAQDDLGRYVTIPDYPLPPQ